jgi:hypothetical protein
MISVPMGITADALLRSKAQLKQGYVSLSFSENFLNSKKFIYRL